ncbi:MAG: IS110 family transposase, partial [Gemmatimonadaceae bacterium]
MSARYIGSDVAKAQLEIAVHGEATTEQVANDEPGIAALLARCEKQPPTLVVLEATGGYELALVSALGAAGLPVVVVNPR